MAHYSTSTASSDRRQRDMPARLHAIDSAKGVGILLVVFGHAWRGAYEAGLFAQTALFDRVDHVIYAFHMPLFFLLSGLLFLDALQKHPAERLLADRVRRLLWPMALWTWLFFVVKFLAGSATNEPVTFGDFPLVPLPPYEHFWFLWALFLIQSLAIAAFAALGPRIPAGSFRWIAGAAAMILALTSSLIFVPSLIWGPMVEHLPYFLAGIAIGGFVALRPPIWLSLLCSAAFLLLLSGVAERGATVPESLVLVLLLWGVWCRIDRSGADALLGLKGLRYLGRASMAIYLSHTMFSAAVRIALLRAGEDDLSLVLLLTTAAGIVFPLLLLVAARRYGLVRILGL